MMKNDGYAKWMESEERKDMMSCFGEIGTLVDAAQDLSGSDIRVLEDIMEMARVYISGGGEGE